MSTAGYALLAAGFVILLGVAALRRRGAPQHDELADLRHRVATQSQNIAKLEKELSERSHEIDAKSDELQRFTYAVSHDLKSPLVTIQGFLGYLEQDIGSGDATRIAADIAKIRGAADKIEYLLDELLKLSRIGTVGNTVEEFPLTHVAEDVREAVAGQITERGVDVVVAPDLPIVLGDRARLFRVLQNLLENAVKYMGAQNAPRIEIGAHHQQGDFATIYVRDNGIGIERGDRKKIFALFEQLDSSAEGIGMGLTMVKRIVEVHGGRVWVESGGRDQGSTFLFTLPTRTELQSLASERNES